MSKIERIQKYIDRTNFPEEKRHAYCMDFDEMQTFKKYMSGNMADYMLLLFEYGRAKGYRAAKAEVRA